MYSLVYAEINIICIYICVLILYRLKKNLELKRSLHYYSATLISLIAMLVLDTGWILINGRAFPLSRELNCVLCTAYLFLCGYVCYRWLLYTMVKLASEQGLGMKCRALVGLPMLILLVLCAATPWTGWMLTIDESFVYHRGPFHIIQVIISYGYVLWATALSLSRAAKASSPFERSECLTLAAFAFFPAAGALIQVLFTAIPLTGPSIMLALLTVYIILQDRQITRDRLTGLNNRYDFNRHLFEKLSDTKKRRELHLTMLDVNSFKHINDSFGHLEGDRALIRVAAALREACSGKNSYAARFGGDEFVVVWECEPGEGEDMEERIAAELEKIQQTSGSSYQLELAMGTACYDESLHQSAEQFIDAADALLYKAKRDIKENKKCSVDSQIKQ